MPVNDSMIYYHLLVNGMISSLMVFIFDIFFIENEDFTMYHFRSVFYYSNGKNHVWIYDFALEDM